VQWFSHVRRDAEGERCRAERNGISIKRKAGIPKKTWRDTMRHQEDEKMITDRKRWKIITGLTRI